MSALVCGLDVHKDSTYATILNSEGKIVNQTRMSNEKVLPYLSHFDVGKVGMESSNQIASSRLRQYCESTKLKEEDEKDAANSCSLCCLLLHFFTLLSNGSHFEPEELYYFCHRFV